MLTPGENIERYEVVELLGVGGHAAVYRLRHTTLDSDHALKVVNIPRADIRARLIQEGRIQARLNHPNIVPVTDVLDVGGLPALLMPFVDGPELGRWLERRRPVPLPTVVAVFTDIVRAVDAAHAAGLVHRDLKPGNILMDRRDGRWVPRVTDFGIAKIVDAPTGSPRTRTGIGMGTPAYMAPEQIADAAHVDRRADIFALGCLLYELVVGQRLYRAGHPLQVVADITATTPADLSGIQRPISEALRAVLTGCLEKDRDRRLPDCSTVLDLLAGHAGWTPPPGTDAAPSAAPPTAVDATPLAPQTPLGTAPLAGPRTATAPPASTPTPAAPTSHLPAPVSLPLPPPPDRRPVWLALGALGAVLLGLGWLAASPDTPAPTVADASVQADRPSPEAAGRPPAEAAPPPAPVSPPDAAHAAASTERSPSDLPPEPAPAPVEPPPAADPTESAPPPSDAPASERPPRAAPPDASGTLRINARPWSEVWVDGTHLGRTWQTLELPAGRHSVRLQDATGRTHSSSVTVSATDTTLFCWDFDTDAACAQ